ncbi:unnamed protein product, partial [Musa acuminata subsp. burmannicoides]
MKEQLASAVGDAIESHAVGKEQSFGLEDAIKIVASTSQEVLEAAPSTSVDEVAKLVTDKHLECQGTNSFLKQMRDELSGSKAGISEKIDVELEKPIMHLVEGEATKVASEESKLSFRTTNPESVWRVEPTAAVCIKETVSQGDEVDTKLEDLQVPELQNPDLVEKTVGDTDDLRMVTEVPCFEHVVPITGVTDNGNAQMPS